MKQARKFETFCSPGGFIEQRYIGVQTPESMVAAINELIKCAKEKIAEKEPALMLVDATDVPKIDISGKMLQARKEAVQAMATAQYDRVAVYGNAAVQIMVNTLVLIAGKRDKIRVFADRIEALRWLKS